jgi:two-component system cell cycle response regulator DivK
MPATRAIPVVALTAHVLPADRGLALSAGFDGYVAKPFQLKTLAGVIAERLASA